MRTETWRSVKGYEGYYEVSDMGRVRSLDRVRRNGKHYKGKMLKPHANTKGYLQVHLSDRDSHRQVYVHRIVLEAFMGKCPKGYNVDHINRDKKDNRLRNLRYLPIEENNAQGTKTTSRPVAQFDGSGNYVAKYDSQMDASRKTGISNTQISNAMNGKCTHAGGYIWVAYES